VHLKIHKDGKESPFTSRFEDGEVIPVPVAHAEGRFTLEDPERFRRLRETGQIPLRYVTPEGDEAPGFPWNPNGSLLDAAGVTNPAGNVLALMPHPERAAWLRQVPATLEDSWGRRRRRATGSRREMEAAGPGFKVFQSLADYLIWGAERKEAR